MLASNVCISKLWFLFSVVSKQANTVSGMVHFTIYYTPEIASTQKLLRSMQANISCQNNFNVALF